MRGKRGHGAGGKTPVIGLLKRVGKVFIEIVENCSKQALMPIIMGQVLNGSTVYTDNWKSYDGLVLDGDKHFRIHHHENQFARDKNHVNGFESKLGTHFGWFRKADSVAVMDAKPDNFILSPEGIVPIDLQMAYVDLL